jgi:hypothetical protein
VARKDNTSREAPLGPDLRRRTPDPCEVRVRSSRGDMPGPPGGSEVPPERGLDLSKVPGRRGPQHKQGSGADTCPGFTLRSPLRRRPAAAAWLVAHDISQRAKPYVRPIQLCSLCIYCGEDAPPATMLTDDTPSQHLMRPVQSASRWRQGHPAGGASDQSVGEQCARVERCTVLIIPSTRSFPCMPRIRRSRASGHKKIAPAANICGSKRYILYVPGPTCRGPVPLFMPPSAIKMGGMQRYTQAQSFRLTQTLTSSYRLSANTSHSGVGCYALAARTTLNPCVFLCSSRFPTNKKSA